MLDPITTGYLADVAANVTASILGVLGSRLRQSIEATPRQKALERCYQAALAAWLPVDDPLSKTYQPVLKAFVDERAVIAEFAKLVRGRAPDQETLVESFADITEGRGLPPFDFSTRLGAGIEAFLQVAEQEPELAETIQTAQLRDATQLLTAVATDINAIRQAVEVAKPSTGDVNAKGDIDAGNLVTGTQINHIVHVYRGGGGTWDEADYRAALARYLAWLEAAMGRVVLRGIKSGGQQAIELSLDEIYVPLAAEALPEARETLKRNLGRSTRGGRRQVAPAEAELLADHAPAVRITMHNLLNQANHLAVIGTPGCGKTTVLQHIAWTLAEVLRTNHSDLAAERLGLAGELPLPIYVPLSLYADHRRRFADHADPRQRQLATFINNYLLERQAGLNLPNDFFATLLNQGRHIMLLLDGLDEVPNEDERALVSQAVRDLTNGRPHARMVVTSRTQAYQGKAVLGQEFRVVRVLPLEPEQVADLIRRAYRAIYPTEVERDDRERQAEHLISSVTSLEAEWGGAETTQQALANRLVALLTDPALLDAPPARRATAGQVLARLGDPRDAVGTQGKVPDLAWCKVPAGPFRLGAKNNEEADDDEKPQHELTLPTFYIARYPVTNAQFAPFVEDGGYNDRQWWTDAGRAWLDGAEPNLSGIADADLRKLYADWLAQRPVERRHEPYYWHDERLNLPTQPVTGVSWYEAMAYCAWLQQKLIVHGQSFIVDGAALNTLLTSGNWQVRLPTEAEWEKAGGWDVAAGRKRVYAWGDEWDETKANVAEHVGLPSAAGVFPAGAAACGAMDMTGNVWEWTLSRYMDYPYRHDTRHDPEGETQRVLRGGAWSDYRRLARVSSRNHDHPGSFSNSLGVQVVVGPVLLSSAS